MKRSSIKWILIGVLIIVGVYLYYRYTTKEGFATTISNIQYNFKEVFLVAPTSRNEKGPAIDIYREPTDNDYKLQGYTKNEAQALCEEYGGRLATVEQLKKAYDNNGNWCAAGWTDDGGDAKAYYLPTRQFPCQLTATTIPSTVPHKEVTVDANGKKRAFAICYAVKPQQGARFVASFNKIQYPMIDPSILNKVMVGDESGSDIFPAAFTVSQAYYALDTNGTDTNNKFNFRKARDWLIENYDKTNVNENVDGKILNSLGQSEVSTPWIDRADVISKSCDLVKLKDNDVSEKILSLQRAFRDVSGYVIAAVKSKEENAKIQSLLFEVCSNTNSVASPACAKLATLDFDLFYTSPTHNTLADLEVLNQQLYMRREEVCTILRNIRNIKRTLGCPYTPNAAECTEGCKITPATATTKETVDCSNTTIFDINGIGALRYSLEQLSPLFDKEGYTDILKSVMERLSYIVQTPSLANFNNSIHNMKLISTAIREIQELVQNDASV